MALGRDYRSRSFLLTEREFTDFLVRLEFNLATRANSAIGIRATEGEWMPHVHESDNYKYDHPMIKLLERSNAREQTGTSHWLRSDGSVGLYLCLIDRQR